jgi:hypothetical protein
MNDWLLIEIFKFPIKWTSQRTKNWSKKKIKYLEEQPLIDRKDLISLSITKIDLKILPKSSLGYIFDDPTNQPDCFYSE